MEIRKDVVGYEGYYQVSNLGNVRSIDRVIYSDKLHIGTERQLRQTIDEQEGVQGYGI